MSSCQNFPSGESIFILSSEDEPQACQCNKVGENYICAGESGDKPCVIQDGFWKLMKGKGDSCRWWRCRTPFKTDDKGKPVYKDGKLDVSDFSDCTITNFPYYITKDCKVYDLFYKKGNAIENDFNCCKDKKKCNRDDALKYKTLDTNLVSNALNYKCDPDYGCVETLPGLGDFTNPFCDYQCTAIRFPRNYTCIDGHCQQVADPQSYGQEHVKNIDCKNNQDCGIGYKCVISDGKPRCEVAFYDNPFCDAVCPEISNLSFDCDSETKKCITRQGKDVGKYSTPEECEQACGTPIEPIDNGGDTEISEASDKGSQILRYTLYGLIILVNIIIIYVLIFLINKSFAKNKDGKSS